jgi:tetratricopeptide (TPR) repeat protein
MDILSMVALLNLFLSLYGKTDSSEPCSIDWLGMGSVFEAMGEYERGLTFYGDVLRYGISDEEKKKTLLRLGRINKKRQDYEAAVKVWEEAITCKGFSIEPYEELAKVYEHRLVDLGKAKAYTTRALENLDLLVKINGRGSYRREKEGLMRRLKRLNKRLAQSEEQNDGATSAGRPRARTHSPRDG